MPLSGPMKAPGNIRSANTALASAMGNRTAPAELENSMGGQAPKQEQGMSELAKAMLQAGGTTAPTEISRSTPQDERAEAEQFRKAELTKRTVEINQVDPDKNFVVFRQREEEAQLELKRTREELSILYQREPINHKEIDTAIFEKVTVKSIDGAQGQKIYYANLGKALVDYQRRAHLAKTWLKEQAVKNAKKQRQQGGLEGVAKGSTEEATEVHKQMHHEVTAAAGG